MDSEIKRRARQYGAFREISKIGSSDPVRAALQSAFDNESDGEFISGARKTVTVDQSWLTKCEETLPHIKEAIDQCRSLIKKDGEVVRIDRAKRPSKDSVAHLARHSNYIKSIKEDGMPEPEEIYITENDEDYAVYENRFLYAALSLIRSFVSVRYEQISRLSSEAGVSMRIKRSSKSQSGSLSYTLEMSETSNGGESATDLSHQYTMIRLRTVMNAVTGYLCTPLMKNVEAAPKLQPPIVRTNIIKNNVHFAAVYDLYMFLSSYTGDGYTVRNDATNEKRIPKRLSDALCDIAALQYFLVYQGAFDGWDDSESACDEDEEEKRGAELRKLKLDVEAAREELKSGKKTAEEYIDLLEKSNARLTGAYESAGEEMSALRKKDREQRRQIIKLGAEHDIMTDKMKKTVADAEERIKENAVRTEKFFSDKANIVIERHNEEFEAERKGWEEERDLLNGRLHAYGIINNEDGADAEINDRENFIKLEREHKALHDYYKREWAKAKRRIRATEFKNRGNGGEEDKE